MFVKENVIPIELVPDAVRRMLLDYLYNACLTIYRSWVEGGKCIGTEALSELAVALICRDIRTLIPSPGIQPEAKDGQASSQNR